MWIEKILEPDERLRDWPVSGTVGYEFLNDVCALFVDRRGRAGVHGAVAGVSGERRSFRRGRAEAKLEQAAGRSAPEMERLARVRTWPGGREALAAAVASLPIYRTYVRAGGPGGRRGPRGVAAPACRRDRRALLLERPAPAEFVTRFQQTTPPVVAKGVEDTAFYRYARLVALYDVGGDPGRFGISVAAFTPACRARASASRRGC